MEEPDEVRLRPSPNDDSYACNSYTVYENHFAIAILQKNINALLLKVFDQKIMIKSLHNYLANSV